MLTMAALYPHLHNLAFAITSPREHLALRLRPTFDAAGLTEREREVRSSSATGCR